MVDKHIPNDTILYLNGVSVSFDGFKAINGLSIVLKEGELRAIIGPNGAGKSTMMDIITGKTRPDVGDVYFKQEIDLTKHDEADIANLGIGRKFQKPSVIETLSVWENLELALAGNRTPWQSLVFKLTNKDKDRLDEMANYINLGDQKNTLAGDISHGQKQWLEIGMLLLQEPEVLLVDEPAAGMTDEETFKTADLLRDVAKSRSVIVVEHDMEFVKALDCKVTVLHEGSVLSEGPLDVVQQDEQVIEVYLGR
ncbi:urea ABC transporter ATP-binding protein UrtD [Litoribrevibacter albus]|jgi:urea transport system ATP-binding protein|uniref:ABC transporter ATP-binding protein n=1 Tax=Litoribrevibacter albus TaxID=1473156 RepID=A0AA37SDU5_9GAMM|nr:urea ABC transporter ATP-binding protein UrtD [Litoribrevibacter albus]GLQ32628.1 ABC transporter ATP-binding protein [Litoribrevibacter albus]